MRQGHRRDRKKRRLLYGAAAAVVATATIGTIAVASPGVLGSSDEKNGASASLQEQFAAAADEFDVPQSVLMAVSYQQTRWESHDGEPSTTGAYNVMGLTKVDPEDVQQKVTDEQIEHFNGSGRPEVEKTFDREKVRSILEKAAVDTDDPRLHTLDKAAELIDSSTETVQNDSAASIRAGAALLADYQKQAGAELSQDPGDWYPAVARYSQSPEKKGPTSSRSASSSRSRRVSARSRRTASRSSCRPLPLSSPSSRRTCRWPRPSRAPRKGRPTTAPRA
ncbi:hypothetical protein AB6O49_08645 [Streptomyces sp. SBR177]